MKKIYIYLVSTLGSGLKFKIYAAAMTVLLVLLIIFFITACIKSKKKKIKMKTKLQNNADIEQRRLNRIAELKSKKSRIDADISKISSEKDDIISHINYEEEIIQKSYNILNEKDEKRLKTVTVQKEGLETLLKKQTSGPFKSFRKSSACSTLLTIQKLDSEYKSLRLSLISRQEDKDKRLETVKIKTEKIESERKEVLSPLLREKAECEIELHDLTKNEEEEDIIHVFSKKGIMRSAKKLARNEAKQYKKDKKAAINKAKEDLAISKREYADEKKCRLKAEKDRDMTVVKAKIDAKKNKKIKKPSEYISPIIETEYLKAAVTEDDSVKTIIADIHEDNDFEIRSDENPKTEIFSDKQAKSLITASDISENETEEMIAETAAADAVEIGEDETADNDLHSDKTAENNDSADSETEIDAENEKSLEEKMQNEKLSGSYEHDYSDIPATPLNLAKNQKPITEIILKDPDKRKYSVLTDVKPEAEHKTVKRRSGAEKQEQLNELEKAASSYAGKWLIRKTDEGYFAELVTSGNEVLLSTENYTSLSGVKSGVSTLKKNIVTDNITISIDKNGSFRFKIFSSGNKLLCISEKYDTKYKCDKAIETAKEFAETAVIMEENH